MTTIAYKDGWLVSDSRETFGNRVDTDRSKKIYRLPDGALYGGAGSTGSILALHEKILQAIKMTKSGKRTTLPNVLIKGVKALLVANRKEVYYYEKGGWQKVNYPYAVGSGSDYAIAAMDAGASAEQAVRIAMKRDVHSGGRIQKLKV